MYMALAQRAINYGPAGVETTLKYMRKLIYDSDKDADRVVKETAHRIVQNIPPHEHLQQVKAVTAWVRKNLHYVRDIYNKEEVTSPVFALKQIWSGGLKHSSDCDDYTVLISALLRSIGFPVRLEALAVSNPRYDHARLSVFVSGKWLPIEGTKYQLEVGQGARSVLPIMSLEL